MFAWESYEDFESAMFQSGVFAPSGVSHEGEFTIDVDWDLFFEKYPEVAQFYWDQHCKDVDETLSDMVDKGLLEMYFDGEQAVYSLTEYGKQFVPSEDEDS